MRPAGALLHPRGGSTPWHSSQTNALLAWKFGLPATHRFGCRRVRNFFEGFTRRHVAPDTWHVAPRDHRHRRSGVFGASFETSAGRIGFADPALLTKVLGHTHWLTDWLTDRQTGRPAGRPIWIRSPYTAGRVEISIQRMDFVHSLHFDFELEAICFEPLVSRYISFVFMQFRLVMFIEAGDVTHRRRGQNRNEEFRDFF